MYSIAFSLTTNQYLHFDFENLSIKSIFLHPFIHCPYMIFLCLRVTRDLHQQFPSSWNLLIKHLFDFQLRSFQSRSIIMWRITWYSCVHVEYPFDQPSSFIILLGWAFYNSKSFIPNESASPFGRKLHYQSQVIYRDGSRRFSPSSFPLSKPSSSWSYRRWACKGAGPSWRFSFK